jgi:hypothetical protein
MFEKTFYPMINWTNFIFKIKFVHFRYKLLLVRENRFKKLITKSKIKEV